VIAAAAGVLAIGAWWVTLGGCGSGSDDQDAIGAGRPRAEASPAPDVHGQRGDTSLDLARGGQPIIWLRPGTTIALHDSPGGRMVTELHRHDRFGSTTVLAVFRTRGEWAGVPTPALPNGQLGWVKLDPSRLRDGWTHYSIRVDLSRRVAQLRLRDRLLRSFAVTVGAPASPTPVGRFAVTDTFDGNLNPGYGCCAVAITATQPNLPSGWVDGNRIAIHGTEGPLGAAISHGCIRAANADVSALVRRISLGTPVIIRR
jgi:hypothetical protein